MNKVLCVAPHPDDETLGCGGTLLRHLSAGDEVYWLIMTDLFEKEGFTSQKIAQRKREIQKVSELYKFTGYHQLPLPTATLDTMAQKELISLVSEYINSVEPNIIYAPFKHDAHSDHATVFNAISPCTKTFRYPFVKKFRIYETLSETEFNVDPNETGFRPNLWVDISDFLEKKIEIMKIYSSEIHDHPFPRSVENIIALSTLRGATVSVKAAESFIVTKDII